MNLQFSPSKTFKSLAAAILLLLIAHLAFMANWHLGGIRNKYTLLPLAVFDLSADAAIPTWFSSLLLLSAAALLLVLAVHAAKAASKWRFHWFFLSAVFLLMSIDEVAALHERAGGLGENLPLSEAQQAGPWLHYGWVVGGILFVGAFFIAYLPFLLRALDKHFRALFVLSGAVFVGGAIGVEMFNGRLAALEGSWNWQYALQTTLEEGLEMFGVALFVYVLMRLIEKEIGPIRLQIGPGA